MKKLTKIKSILVTLGIIFVLSILINANFSYNQWKSHENLESINEFKLKRADYLNLTGSPIYINGNGDWALTAATEEWCFGSGTVGDPYIIKNVLIDGLGVSNCIEIRNSDVHFLITDCILFNSGIDTYKAGIYLENVKNGQLLEDIESGGHDYGIRLTHCFNITIVRNNLYYNYKMGIILELSNNNLILGNYMSNNVYEGIYLGLSNNSKIIGNIATDNGNFGIYIGTSSKNNTISENVVHNNEGGGITASTSNNSTIRRNNVIHNKIGIEIWNSNDNIIYENYISDSYGLWGVWVAGESSNNLFYKNCFIKNAVNAWDDGSNNNWNLGGDTKPWRSLVCRIHRCYCNLRDFNCKRHFRFLSRIPS